jgi:RNA polymerase sigma-70 factor (ECF subfamily)
MAWGYLAIKPKEYSGLSPRSFVRGIEMAIMSFALELPMTAVRRGLQPLIPALRRFARALVRNSEGADDLVQDTIVRALRGEHLFHGGDLRTWLFTILLNLDRNRRRGLARKPFLAVIEDVDPPGDPVADGSARDIARGLALLPPEQREVLLLVTLEGMSYREAADAQGVPIGTVMSRLSRARTTLREYLDGELPPLRDVSNMGKRP